MLAGLGSRGSRLRGNHGLGCVLKDRLAAPGIFAGTDLACIRGDRLLFRRLGFAVGPGGALVLTGANGSGKSSLLRLMAGLLAPAAGALSWAGRPIAEDREAQRGRTHYLGHQDAIKPTLTVRETLALHARLRGADTGPAIENALEKLGIDHLIDLPGRQLSAGQKRRVGLARLVLCPAPLWLLDEPTVGLDTDGLAAFAAICAAHRASGGVIVAATHADLGIGPTDRLEPEAFAPDPADLEALA
jgi:heme exporter protein A